MLKKLLILFVCLGAFKGFSQNFSAGIRESLPSKVLNEERFVSIYLPPSYNDHPEQHYPILYILDGDYNFHYVTGLIELQSGIAENIPEMIVVGIAGKGTSSYRRNCKPPIKGVEDSGTADKMLGFIETELMPYIQKNYRSNAYNILGGHSIGGVFVCYAALTKPELFKHYLAISPALWWADHAMDGLAKRVFKKNPDLNPSLYISLANEEGMGIKQFLDHTSGKFLFKEFPKEDHNSIGHPSYQWALKSIFSHWKVNNQFFKSSKELEEYLEKNQSYYSQNFRLSNAVLYNTVKYILKDDREELQHIAEIIEEHCIGSYAYYMGLVAKNFLGAGESQKAKDLLLQTQKRFPNAYQLNQTLAETYQQRKEYDLAKEQIDLAIDYAEMQNVRQWQLNELLDFKEQLSKVLE